ncbi:tripartite tricarboxylate transporter substrate binding protein [Jidongwangia harbinensis]|uniref:tripartite tricarboxylate transporter substrate binding protein n=1 Tax=Jidongwangia harbinensis TaxID=2878561 RepID=UPI001CD9596F|nr:tripartite tricarboxylate transporter substrate binding protein [Jidongwangia harbinensis]MCA2211860.1 tripartite tricarboxylate transporter substrate binding protein [Jidongwangia harbinensis]
MQRRAFLAGALALGLAGCAEPADDLRIMVPNPPGSGYDITARVLAGALDADGIARGVEVFNLPGAGGVVGLRRLALERGNGRLLMLMGLGLVGAEIAAAVPAGLRDITAIARLVQEPAVLVVRRDSAYRSLDDLIAAWRADPAGVAAGGGSSVGGPDHLATMLLAEAAGLAPARVAYRRHDGGGDLLAAILSREVAFAMSGLSEYADQITSGTLRALAVTSTQPVDQVPAPTVRGAGLDVVFNNWRGLVAPPGLTAADAAAIRSIATALAGSASWAAARDRFGWTGAYLAGEPFAAFLAEEHDRVARVLRRLGLTVAG